MSETLADPILDALVGDFGGNYFFALDLLEDYRRDPGSVDPSWREYFDARHGCAALLAESDDSRGPRCCDAGRDRTAPRAALARQPATAAPVALVRTGSQAVAAAPKSKALVVPGHPARRHRPADPRRRHAHRREHGGEPHRPDRHLHPHDAGAHARGEPHHPQQAPGRAGRRQDQLHAPRGLGHPARARHVPAPERRLRGAGGPAAPHPARQRCAWASRSTCRRRTARRTLLVPNIKDAGTLDFAGVPEGVRRPDRRARARARSRPTTSWARRVSLTNPGTVGTSSSAPRLMPGQGLIVATGALDYPGRVPLDGAAHAVAARHQQGHDHDLDLRPPHHPGRGVRAVPGAASRSC